MHRYIFRDDGRTTLCFVTQNSGIVFVCVGGIILSFYVMPNVKRRLQISPQISVDQSRKTRQVVAFESDQVFGKYDRILLFQFVFTKYVIGFRNYDGFIFVVFDVIVLLRFEQLIHKGIYIFFNILTALCRVYIIIPINVGLRNKRGSF